MSMIAKTKPQDVRWNRCNFDEVVTDHGNIVTYCDGCHDKHERCNCNDVTAEDVVFLAGQHGRLQIVKQQLSNIEFNINQDAASNPSKEDWLRMLKSMIESCG